MEEQIIYPLLPVNMLVGGGFFVLAYAVVSGGFRLFSVVYVVELHGVFGSGLRRWPGASTLCVVPALAGLSLLQCLKHCSLLPFPCVSRDEPVAVLGISHRLFYPRVSGDFLLPCCPAVRPVKYPR